MTNYNQEVTQNLQMSPNMQRTQNMPMQGEPVPGGNVCKKCGTVVAPDKKYCTTCGEPMMQYVRGANDKKKILPLIIVLCVVIILLIGLIVGGVVLLKNSDNDNDRDERNHRISRDEDSDEETESETEEYSATTTEESSESSTEEIYTIPDIGIVPPATDDGDDGNEDEYADYTEREAEMLRAAKKYSGALTVRIITSTERIYTIECMKLENNTQSSDLLYIDINTFVGTDQRGNIVNLNQYTDGEVDDDMEPQTADYLYQVTVDAKDGFVNMRTGPGTSFEIIVAIDNGETLNIYEEAEGGKWLRTKYNGKEGWIAASQVKKANIP